MTAIARAELGAAPRELVHDISADIVLSLTRFRGDCAFAHWANGIAVRKIQKWRRTEGRQQRLLCELRTRNAYPETMRPDDAADARLLIERIEHAHERLAAREWDCLALVYFESRSVRAVAELLGISAVAVRMSICRARRRLRACLSGQLAPAVYPVLGSEGDSPEPSHPGAPENSRPAPVRSSR